jgi:hypothetical protein
MRSPLFDFVRQAFLARTALPAKTSKHRPIGESDTGAEASAKYALRHPRGLRQLQRRFRIANGLRPLKFDVPGKREKRCADKAKTREAAP